LILASLNVLPGTIKGGYAVMKNITEKENMEEELVEVENKGVLPGSGEPGKADGEDTEIDMYVKFRKPYVFEDDVYEGIDLLCLEDLSTRDMLEIEKRFYKLGIMSMNPENTISYAKITVQRASSLPIEFFDGLPVREMLKIKSRVVNFFYN